MADFRFFTAALALTCTALPPAKALAQDTHPNGVIIEGAINQTSLSQNKFNSSLSLFDGRMCIGNACDDHAVGAPGSGPLKLRWTQADIVFEDSSTSSFPDRDWRLMINDSSGTGIERFSIKDETSGFIPFTIVGDAPENALFMASDGRLGLGTALPAAEVHVLANDPVASIMLEETHNTDGGVEINATSSMFNITSLTHGTVPFHILHYAPTGSFYMQPNGDIGLGTDTATAPLHVLRSDGSARILVEETGGSGAQELFKMQSNGGSYFTLSNTASGRDWFFNHENAAQGRFIITSSTNPSKGLFLGPDGDMKIGGTLTTGGGTCGGGCDRVFSDDYDLPSIGEHADAMWSLGYLPNVGPTPENAPINVSDKLGRMLNELEHAHIYIAQQQDVIDGLGTYVETLNARLAMLEKQRQD